METEVCRIDVNTHRQLRPSRWFTTLAQLDPESNHTSIVSVPLRKESAMLLYFSGSRSSVDM